MVLDRHELIIHCPKNNDELRDKLRYLLYGEDQLIVKLYDSPTTIFNHHNELNEGMIQSLLKILKEQKAITSE